MIAAQLITQWLDGQLSTIRPANGYFYEAQVLHNYADAPQNMPAPPAAVLIAEATAETVKDTAAGLTPRRVKLSREVFINGLVTVPPGTRPNDALDALAFDVRRALYPAAKSLTAITQIKQFSEGECRFIFPDKGSTTAKLLMRFNFEFIENYEV